MNMGVSKLVSVQLLVVVTTHPVLACRVLATHPGRDY